MPESLHHIGEWATLEFTTGLPTGHVAVIPLCARDEESAHRCIQFSVGLLGYRLFRAPGGQIGGQG